ncbi:progesterone binding protein [Coprinopsis cinerea okayama7|uniref:Progesterone binding protein n=1 Tax=Coprinopsis cinerea (strain Okayama-7 / 130 / ATCC MYA-4618 / FGSC 9003) TaxID=240176 RepID=A8NSB7_COPC7|nr:progesterone binding protein [Coprinopsis cinerea okayama7\|eukprot:XP_001835972.1 progesterone binding protein [Coprinopsis cinerea okayama7\
MPEMQPPVDNLDPPKHDPFTVDELAQYDGNDKSKPIYLAIKGTVFDVSRRPEMYGPGGKYHPLAGRDASRALGKGSLEKEDLSDNLEGLDEKQREKVDWWFDFFEKRYNIVGSVVGRE